MGCDTLRTPSACGDVYDCAVHTHTKKVRKQFLLDPELLQRARADLKAKTDTEAVEKALKLATANERMARA